MGATSTASPTAFMDQWYVGDGHNDIIVDGVGLLDGVYQIEHVIGPRYGPGSVYVELLDYGCNTIMNSTGLEVSVQGEDYIPGENFSYNITLDSSLISQNVGGFVSFSNQTNSQGSIAFCTRVTAEHDSIAVSFTERTFTLPFDLTKNEFSLNNVEIQPSNSSVSILDIDNPFTVIACQCDDDMNCVQEPVKITQDESLIFCLETSDSNVHISNFEVIIEAGTPGDEDDVYVFHEVVLMGTDGWDEDVLATVITSQDSSNKILIKTLVVAEFFTEGKSSIDITGNAFLEFDESKHAMPFFSQFYLTVPIDGIQVHGGCFQIIFQQMKSLFLTTLLP